MGPRLYSGWGVRTLAVGEGRYNPIGYHLGTVWPFDNSFIAWGLRRYGYKEEAARIASDILDAAAMFDGRLPEAFGGYDRDLTKYPVQYPTACARRPGRPARHHPEHPVRALGVGQDVAVERPRAGLVALDDHVPALARVHAERVARERRRAERIAVRATTRIGIPWRCHGCIITPRS